MKKQSVSKNFVFQLFYQFIILVIPLILSPYLTRTIGKTGLGIYTYSNSIAYYFVIFAMLGISRHGQRVISANSESNNALRKEFWSLLYVHFVFSLFAIIAYAMFVILFVIEDRYIYWIQIFYVASALFDITWFFQGLENFRSIIIKNLVVKIVECSCIFLFVHSSSDLWKYALISTGGLLIGQMVMIPQAIKIAPPVRINIDDAKIHIKPMLVLSVSVVAAALYTVFDKTLLGIMTTKDNVALYEYSNRIINIPKSFITVAGTVLFPRACKMVSENDISGQKKFFKLSILVTSFIGFASIFGLLAVSDNLVSLYYGESFSDCGAIIKSMCPLIIIIGLGDILRTQYIIPMHMDSKFVICLCLNAVINLILSVIFIPYLGIYGAVLGTTAAECFGLFYQLKLCRNHVSFLDLLSGLIPFLFIGIMMHGLLLLINTFPIPDGTKLACDVIIGMIIYGFLTFIYAIRYEPELFGIIKRILSRK